MGQEWLNIKHTLLAALALAGAAAAELLGGWDQPIQALLWCMGADYITGLLVAGVFKRSAKSGNGALDSRAGFKGLCKKGAQLVLVLLAAQLDQSLGGGFSRTAVVLFFLANETLSVLENLGLMGVPYPAFLKDALEVLRQKGNSGDRE